LQPTEHRILRTFISIMICAVACHAGTTLAQSLPTATQPLRVLAFAGATVTNTGLDSGANTGLTAGADLSLPSYRGLEPSAEVRGTFPFDQGSVDSQKNILGGLKVALHRGRLFPYANLLLGRGEITYPGNGHQVPGTPIFYTQSSTIVISPGAGLDLDLDPHFAFKVDLQLQRYSTKVTTSGHIYAEAATTGLVYRFDFNHHWH
jgi:hypothetical protein